MSDIFQDAWSTLYHGDCIEVSAKIFGSNVFDTIITDPPYELNYMERGWDRSGISFQPETWAEMLRVAKPGASLAAFGGSRTFHRIACAIEDGGWLIRDCIMWYYSMGFPKSQDISKAIDKAAGAERKVVGTRDRGAPALSLRMNMEDLERRLAAGETKTADGRDLKAAIKYAKEHQVIEITEPATDEAKLWQGWGTALKPAFEPIILAMKPFDGTFAQNAEKWGVAGLAIDEASFQKPGDRKRLPSNVLLDDGAAKIADEESTVRHSSGVMVKPSRFFYSPKASKKEKLGPWNRHPTIKPLGLMQYLCRLTKTPTGGLVLDPFVGSGTTLVAARLEGRKSIGVEKDPEWFPVARRRLIQSQLR